MKSFIKSILLIAVSFFLFSRVLGCSYFGSPSPPTSYIAAKTGTIFIGRVISKSSQIKTENDYKYRLYRIKFKVERALKGVDNEIQEITLEESITNRTSCSVDPPKFKKGEKWIIHKDLDAADKVSINLFGGSSFYPYWKYVPNVNQSYIEQLEKAIRNPVNTINGHVQMAQGLVSAGNVEVIAQGNGFNLSTKTDKSGFYSFENVPAGNYIIHIRLSYKTKDWFHNTQTVFDAQAKIHNLTYEVTIKNGDTDYHYSIVDKSPIK
jgi:hypothetical protein